ncbi:MAG: flagellar M-ring protein FliF [Betaproteobacteria bacterium]|nr:flagellar M-ring protein FliF [Betaproteobacteria bacterium]MCC6249495.1 flagellar M-ring protein FliF [Rubrivivax sp.]
MDNAVATVPSSAAALAAGSPPAGNGLADRWKKLPARTQMMALAGIAALVAVIVLLTGSARDADWRVLFPNLSEKDGGQVIERLTQMNVPYRFSEGGGMLMVPASRVHELRMKLSAAGLPTGGVGAGTGGPGYELLDKSPFGQTQGQERMNVQRAIEGELTRTIQSLASVQSARVHLAIPHQNGFFREQQKPSASVVLTLHPGRTLERSQIAGIVHLVSSSVPELNPKAVSVIDGSGALLSGTPSETDAEGLDGSQLQYRRELEAGHLRRILALLEPVVGRDNVRASVTAEIDFSQVMQTAEAWRPNQGADARIAIREQRTQESTQPGSATPAGVPGAMTNQPPVNATAPITGASAPLQAAGGGGAGASTAREGATRYELDKTVTVTRAAVGQVKRLSAAVVVNHRSSTDPKGKVTSAPLSEKELEQLTALVQQGIGFNGERGDQVKVINAPFRADPAPAAETVPMWQQPWLTDLLKSTAAPLALGLVGLVIVFALLRPAMKQMFTPPPPAPGAQVNEVVGGDSPLDPASPPALAAPAGNDRIEAARRLAKENPAAVANIVRGWVNGEA